MSVNQAATSTTGWTGGGVNMNVMDGTSLPVFLSSFSFPMTSLFEISCFSVCHFVVEAKFSNHNTLRNGAIAIVLYIYFKYTFHKL